MLFSWAKGMFLINSRFKCYKSLFQLSCRFLRCSFMGLLFTEAIWKAAFWRMVPYWEQKNLADISLIGILEFLWPPGTCRVRRYVRISLQRSFGSGKVTPSLLQGLVWWCFFPVHYYVPHQPEFIIVIKLQGPVMHVHLSEWVIVTGFLRHQVWKQCHWLSVAAPLCFVAIRVIWRWLMI